MVGLGATADHKSEHLSSRSRRISAYAILFFSILLLILKAAHAWTDAGTRNAAEAGVVSIEHGFSASNETFLIAKRNGVALVPTPVTEIGARDSTFRTFNGGAGA